MPLGKVDHSKQLLKKIGTLYSEDDLADITIHVEGQRFTSHRVILSAQSSFFKQLLYNGKWERDITLSDVSAAIFGDLLEYFYTGQLSLESTQVENYAAKIVDEAKRFNLELLHRDVVDDMCAYLLSEEPMTEELGDFLDQEADTVIQSDMFVTLPQSRVQELLSRDTFCVKDEVDIFRAAMHWAEGRAEDERKAVLNTVRLPLIQDEDLVAEVWSSKLFGEEAILKALQKRIQKNVTGGRRINSDASTVETHEIPAQPAPAATVANTNLATMDRGASVVAGDNPIIPCILEGEHDNAEYMGYLCHRIQKPAEEQNGIQVQLDQVYNINSVQLHLLDKDTRLVSYYIEVSTQRDGPWTRVVDHTRYKCRGRQLLYFHTTPVRYVKVVGTASTAGDTFALVSLKCSYTETPLPMTHGILEPVDNQALEAAGALLMQGENSSVGKSMLDGIHTDDDGDTYCEHGECIKVALPQPVWLGSLRFKLEGDYSSSYTVDVSADDETWTRVADKSQEDCTSWQSIAFEKRPVSFINFTCMGHVGDSECELVIIYLECPDKETR